MAITLMIRTSYRPDAFSKCVGSIDYPCKTIVSYDNKRAEIYIDGYMSMELSKPPSASKYFYNLYLNPLLTQLTEGHGIFLDDDDTCIPGRLADLDHFLQPGKSYIIPFMRDGRQKPWPALMFGRAIMKGAIGLPCLVLWHEHKKYVKFDDSEEADYKAIRMLADRVKLEWLTLPVVNSPARGWGRMEG